MFQISKFHRMELEFNRIYLPLSIEYRPYALLKEWIDLLVARPFDAVTLAYVESIF